MKLNMRFTIGVFFTLAIAVSSCDTFKDEITPDNYSEVAKKINANWQLSAVSRNGIDITDMMDFTRFHIVLNEDNTYEIENYLPFIVKANGSWSVDDPIKWNRGRSENTYWVSNSGWKTSDDHHFKSGMSYK